MGYQVPAGTEHAVIGGMSEADINAQNQFMRAQPWYQQFLASIGQTPDSVKLDDRQKQDLLRLAQANGIVVDEGDIEIDPAGNLNPKGHKMRNALIGAGIAGAAALTGGAALGAFGGAGAAGSGGVAGLMGSAATVPGATLGAAGGLGGAAAGMGGMAGLAGAGYTVPGATLGAGGGTAAGGGLLSRIGGYLTNGKTSDILGALGGTIGAATQAAGQNRIDADELNMRGNNMYESQLMARSRDEQGQRDDALDNVYRSSWYNNRQPSPYNTKGITPMSDQFKQTLADLAGQGATKLSQTAQYDSNANPALKPFEPSEAGLLEKVGTWAGPILSGAGTVGGILKKKPPVIMY